MDDDEYEYEYEEEPEVVDDEAALKAALERSLHDDEERPRQREIWTVSTPVTTDNTVNTAALDLANIWGVRARFGDAIKSSDQHLLGGLALEPAAAVLSRIGGRITDEYFQHMLDNGCSLAHLAVFADDAPALWMIAKAGGGLTLRASEAIRRESPLHFGCRIGSAAAVRCLAAHAAGGGGLTTQEGDTCLHLAAQYGYADLIPSLMTTVGRAGIVHVDAGNEDGDTPLHLAAFMNKPQCVRMLLFHGAASTIRNRAQESPLEIALRAEDSAPEVVAMLLLPRSRLRAFALPLQARQDQDDPRVRNMLALAMGLLPPLENSTRQIFKIVARFVSGDFFPEPAVVEKKKEELPDMVEGDPAGLDVGHPVHVLYEGTWYTAVVTRKVATRIQVQFDEDKGFWYIDHDDVPACVKMWRMEKEKEEEKEKEKGEGGEKGGRRSSSRRRGKRGLPSSSDTRASAAAVAAAGSQASVAKGRKKRRR